MFSVFHCLSCPSHRTRLSVSDVSLVLDLVFGMFDCMWGEKMVALLKVMQYKHPITHEWMMRQ